MTVLFTLFLKIFAGATLLILIVSLALVFEGAGRCVTARIRGREAASVFQPAFDLIKLSVKECAVPRSACSFFFSAAPWLTLSVTLMIFLYIPSGRLPAVLGTEGDMILIAVLLFIGEIMEASGGFSSSNPYAVAGSSRKVALVIGYSFPFTVVICAMAWIAWSVGLPGAAFSLEIFSAKSIWSEVGSAGVLGLICLCASFAALLPVAAGFNCVDTSNNLENPLIEYSGVNLAMFKLTASLRLLGIVSFFTILFIPVSSSGLWGWTGTGAAIFDFFFFVFKVFSVQMITAVLSSFLEEKFKDLQLIRFYVFKMLPLSLSGLILLTVDVFNR